MVQLLQLSSRLLVAAKTVWKGGSPFATVTALWPTNDEGKYVIEAEGIRVALTNHGAAVANVYVKDQYGDEIDLVLGLDHADMYPETKSNPYLNGIIGRYAGYLSGAGYEVDGREYKVRPNAHRGKSTYNGGDRGWGRRDWDIPTHTKDSITFVMFDKSQNGFPGLFVSCLTHTVTPHEWTMAYGVTPLLAPGPINMAPQTFFNLDGMQVNASNNVLSHKLHLPSAGFRFAMDENGIPTGDLLSNKKSERNDFWSGPRNIGEALEEGPLRDAWDETYMLMHEHPQDPQENPAAILSSPKSGITMELFTNQDALHIQTWDEKDGPLKLKSSQGQGDVPQHGAISIQVSDWPDAVHHPEWRHRKSTWGNKDIYTAYVTYKFKTSKDDKKA